MFGADWTFYTLSPSKTNRDQFDNREYSTNVIYSSDQYSDFGDDEDVVGSGEAGSRGGATGRSGPPLDA